MLNYLNNNLRLIDKFQSLYSEGIHINYVFKKFLLEELPSLTAFDYGRFRVFIDSCLLLLNHEKLNFFYKKQYKIQDLLDEIRYTPEQNICFDNIRKAKFYSGLNGINLYYPFDEKEKNPWEQISTIRRAMAHMQYGHFMFNESRELTSYFLYNKDKGTRQNVGQVIEPIVHDFIHRFYSNYSYGILYKYTFFSRYSNQKQTLTNTLNFYNITCKGKHETGFKGFQPNLLADLARNSRDVATFESFLAEHSKELNIMETPYESIKNIQEYEKFVMKLPYRNAEEYFYSLKTFLDFDSVLSNFLVHISRLNEILYQYCILRDCGKLSPYTLKKEKRLYRKQLLELKEDEQATLSFNIGFTYLKAMNFALRVESDDFLAFNYNNVDVSMFKFDNEDFVKYVNTNNNTKNKLQHYIIQRMRNALMHGHINIMPEYTDNIMFVFSDPYNNRNEKIRISFKDLNTFLSQPCLYNTIPQRTPLLTAVPNDNRKM